jgi:dienelactone hydrolase
MEIFGLHECIKDVTRRLAKLGLSQSLPIIIPQEHRPARLADIAQCCRS